MQPPFTRLFSILNALLVLQQKFEYPTAELPDNFLAGPNIRQGRSRFKDDFEGKKPMPFVRTEVGDFEGYFMKVISGRDIYAFEGIPFAEKPERFRDPVPKSRIEGTFSAKSAGPICFQTYQGTVIGGFGRIIFGDEDCLKCNVYSPHISNKGHKNPNLPVIFNIYGGAFAAGAARDYGPSYLLEQDVILVGCNYRVGAFGFLSTGDAAAPGNWGLKDLALALDWTHKHIRNFGGDPNRIVVMGQSAGAALGHMLMMSSTVKDKIFGAVLISGTALSPWAMMDSKLALRMTWRFAVINFCPTNQGNVIMIDCLRRRNVWILESTQNFVYLTEQWTFKFGPTIEPDVPGALITKPPEQYYTEGLVANIPVMFSQNSKDSDIVNIVLALTGTWPILGRTFLAFLPKVLGYEGKVRNEADTTKKILEFYGPTYDIIAIRERLFEAAQERYFTSAFQKSMRLHSTIAPTFAYLFAYRSKRGLAGKLNLNPNDFGIPHVEDLFYVFNRTDMEPISRNHPDFGVVKLLQSLFTNFATSGEPLYTENNVDKIIFGPVRPPPARGYDMLIIDHEVKTVEIPWETNVTRFWDSLNIQEHPSYVS